jgi:predicted SAM-dependent methyltransferase
MAKEMPANLLSLLKESELHWEIEPKKKHRFLRIEGEVVMALPQSQFKNGRYNANMAAVIKRAIRKIKGA